ncbi:MAG TPA: molybdenum cofactor guanylyltransferase [Candidatus Sumerlaeota bacterium]|nr:molybdenum cofactor guanylyltransferase [Candidatus Sumerlaeota bacterium]
MTPPSIPPASSDAPPAEGAQAALSGIILAGGRSSRYGAPKDAAVLAGQTLLEHVARTVGGLCRELIVVTRPGQAVELTRPARRVTDDPDAPEGPLRGIVAGLAAARCELAVVVACDCPLIEPGLVRLLLARAGPELDAVVPIWRDHPQPLHAIYRVAALPALRALLAAGEASPTRALARLRVDRVAEHDWRGADPDARSFRNINTPADLELVRQAVQQDRPPA